MKIAVNARVLIKDKLEGVGWFIYEVFNHLAKAHPEDEFILFFDRPFSPEFVFSKNVTPVVLFPQARHPLLFVWWFEWSVSRALKTYKPDVFISPDNFLCLNTTIPTVLVVHDIAYKHFTDNDSWINRLYYTYFTPRFLKKATRILTVSEFTKQDILHHFDFLNPEKITICFNGCLKKFTPLSIEAQNAVEQQYTEGDNYFLFVGAVHPRKNVHRLIEAFDTFKKQVNSPIKLVICGRFAWQTGVVKSAFDKAIHKKDIVFTGYVPDADVPKLTASAFAMVYTSLFEGFGLPVLEALYCDVPVITSNTSSMPEVAGDAALLVNPESVSEIAAAMQLLVEKPELRQDLIEKGRVQRGKFSWGKTAVIVYEQLKKVTEKNI